MSSDKIISLIAKLKAMQLSAAKIGNQAEAEAFAAKVSELLTQHKITMSEVEFQAQDKANPLGQERSHKNGGSGVPRSSLLLARAIAAHTFCKNLYIPGVNQVVFVGRETDRKAATELFETLEKVSWSLARKDWRRQYPGETFHRGPFAISWAKSFLEGFAVGVSNRLSNQFEAAKQAAGSEATGLMLRDAFALQEYVDTVTGKGKGHGRKDVGHNSSAYQQGKEHGTNTGINNNKRLGGGL